MVPKETPSSSSPTGEILPADDDALGTAILLHLLETRARVRKGSVLLVLINVGDLGLAVPDCENWTWEE